MNKSTSYSHQSSDLTDNYSSYFEDALGYSWDVWEVTPSHLRVEHDRLLQFGEASFDVEEAIFQAASSEQNEIVYCDLLSLALARHHYAKGEYLITINHLRRILDSSFRSPAIAYDEIYERFARVLIQLRKQSAAFDEQMEMDAERIFNGVTTNPWSDKQPIYRAIYAYHSGKTFEETLAAFLNHDLSLEDRFELIEDIASIGETEVAKNELKKMELQLNQEIPDHPLIVDIQILIARLEGRCDD